VNYHRGAFVAGQLSIVIKAGEDAQKLLRSRIPLTEEEKADLRREVETGKIFEEKLERHRKQNGL
jgi:hypothetical protein